MKKIFILGASALQVPAIRRAKEKGLYVYALDYDPHAVGIPEADEFLLISTIDKEAVLEAAKKYKPDFVVTSTSDLPVRTVAWVNEQLGREGGIAYEDAICATDKAAMRVRMKECGVPIPDFHVAGSKEEFLEKTNLLGDKFVCKPADNAASRGVVLVDKNELKADGKNLEEELLKIYEYTHSFSRSGEVLVEELMTGPEVSVESITVDGEPHIITITDKLITKEPYFVETGHTEPSRLFKYQQEDIRQVAFKAIKALNMSYGSNHTEIKVTPTGAKLVEIAARLGGDYITSRLVPLSTGVDMIDCDLSSAVGDKVNYEKTLDKGSAIRFIYFNEDEENEREHVIKAIDGVSDAQSVPGVTEVVLYKNVGDTAGRLKSSNDRIGHVIATGKDADEAEENALLALSKIHILYE
ncbi:MAG: ATP-grasp domain-containing protein [Butyrivibrio sp.]|nr:ATP-grasp domain-containing protein [Butyrivibrio sp.]